MIIRTLLIVTMCVILLWFWRQQPTTLRARAKAQASHRIFAVLLFGLAVLAVIFPEGTTTIANKLGVGRGADLLLYCLTISFFISLLLQHRHRYDEQARVVSLARALALIQAEQNLHNAAVLKGGQHGNGQ